MTVDPTSWLGKMVESFRELENCTITSWRGTEWALRGGEEAPGQYRDPQVPYLQVEPLQIQLEDGLWRRISTYQNNDVFGLEVDAHAGVDPGPREGYVSPKGFSATRPFQNHRLPTGKVGPVEVILEDGDIAEVSLTVGEVPILLIAGESEENWDGSLRHVRFSENVLIFIDPSGAHDVPWFQPRPPRKTER